MADRGAPQPTAFPSTTADCLPADKERHADLLAPETHSETLVEVGDASHLSLQSDQRGVHARVCLSSGMPAPHQRQAGEGEILVKSPTRLTGIAVLGGALFFSSAEGAGAYYPGKPQCSFFSLVLSVARRHGDKTVFEHVHRYALKEGDTAGYKEVARDTFPAIRECLSRGQNVLVHCQEGLIRSATLVYKFLVEEAGLSPSAALSVIKMTNPAARPMSAAVEHRKAAALPFVKE